MDDIYTTGATVRSCALALREAGAVRVLVATLARAQTESVALWTGDAGQGFRVWDSVDLPVFEAERFWLRAEGRAKIFG